MIKMRYVILQSFQQVCHFNALFSLTIKMRYVILQSFQQVCHFNALFSLSFLLRCFLTFQVIVFTELSPVVYVKSTPTLRVNVCKLLQSQPKNRIKLMEYVSISYLLIYNFTCYRFVESYKNAYGALPTPTKKTRQELQEVLHSFPEIVIRGIKPANIVVELREKSPQHGNS